MVTPEQLSDLSPDSKSAILEQQRQALWVINHWPRASIFLAGVGVVLILVGGTVWKRRQDRLNERESADLKSVNLEQERTRHEIRALIRQNKEADEETVDAIGQSSEVAEIAPTENTPQSGTAEEVPNPRRHSDTASQDIATPTISSGTRANIEALQIVKKNAGTKEIRGMLAYIQAQEEALLYLERLYEGKLDYVRGVRIGRDRADFVVTSDTDEMPHLAVDVATISGPSTTAVRRRVSQAIEWARAASYSTHKEFNGPFRPVIFFVSSDLQNSRLRDAAFVEIERALYPRDSADEVPPMTIILVKADGFDALPLDKSLFTDPSPIFLQRTATP
ncbi:hypothetical protein [Verrucosispora sp. NA02020]|uniref:hypothetical protein n=1 Tax=Verrucosispora sp. NA02020 TaxID=2742132 RepID=UPI0015906EDE|nr:hypothetical protein [Verrucosispora sp. NA02020]QKW13033.1 hypothetical protein HUT12_09655 [Verrucosispora sp. NA02020]